MYVSLYVSSDTIAGFHDTSNYIDFKTFYLNIIFASR